MITPGAPRIRLATPADGAALAAIYAPAVSDAAISFELDPPDAAEMARRVEKTLARTPWIVFERDGAVRGYAYAARHRDRAAYDWSVEVSAYVHPAAHRSGIGRALYTVLFELLKLQGFRNAYAGVTLPNDASVRLHAALGFTPVGVYRRIGYKFGAWHDVAWFERELGERDAQPGPPVALPQARRTELFNAALERGASLVSGAAGATAGRAR